MKLRNGFVSNSSSSSFIVTMKTGEKMTKKILMDTFDVKKNSPLYSFANDLSDWVMKNVEEQSIGDLHDDYFGSNQVLTEDDMIKELLEDDCWESEFLEKIKDKKIRYYKGSASSDSGEALEYYLYEGGIDFENDFIKIENGY